MKIYQRRSPQPLKWLLAFILFCLVMGWTMSDVYGLNVKQNPTQGSDQTSGQESTVSGDHRVPTDTPSSPVPEPTTLVLLTLGLGGGALMLRRKKR